MGVSPSILGIDAGSTLVKLAIGTADRAAAPRFEALPTTDHAALSERIAELSPLRVGLTGAGGARLGAALAAATHSVNEIHAWGRGAQHLVERLGADAPARFLAVSVGTGTSAILVDGEAVTRIGGSALGGGAVIGLGRALGGFTDFEALCRAAERGDASRADLLIGDIYPDGEIEIPAFATAASLAKLAHDDCDAGPDDLAASIMHLVGENLGWICAGLAGAAAAEDVVFGGSTLRDNPVLVGRLLGVTFAAGRRGHLLPDGQFAGALGAYEHAHRA